MKLPTTTRQQQRQEEARQLHEQLWQSYLDPSSGKVFLVAPIEQAGRELQKLSGNLHAFWNRRGYRLRARQTTGGFSVWIEAFTDQPVEAYSREDWHTPVAS
jgi:hypothetical protein